MIIGTAILTLAILNPLLCLLHCAHFSFAPDPLSDQQHQFLCGLAHEGEPTATPARLDWGAPRVVYELVPLVPTP
ncbi:MAG: hypothetical protein HGA65_08830, partial [Oscillochloris sp.]|nr:hypothetical protein [Oscillochloris sp.]